MSTKGAEDFAGCCLFTAILGIGSMILFLVGLFSGRLDWIGIGLLGIIGFGILFSAVFGGS